MTEYPLVKILVFIALSLAPERTEKVTIGGPNLSEMTLACSEAGWAEISSSDGAAWKTEGLSISRVEEATDLSTWVAGLNQHQWSALSILKLSGTTEILKVSGGYWIYPNGIEYPRNKYTVSYQAKK